MSCLLFGILLASSTPQDSLDEALSLARQMKLGSAVSMSNRIAESSDPETAHRARMLSLTIAGMLPWTPDRDGMLDQSLTDNPEGRLFGRLFAAEWKKLASASLAANRPERALGELVAAVSLDDKFDTRAWGQALEQHPKPLPLWPLQVLIGRRNWSLAAAYVAGWESGSKEHQLAKAVVDLRLNPVEGPLKALRTLSDEDGLVGAAAKVNLYHYWVHKRDVEPAGKVRKLLEASRLPIRLGSRLTIDRAPLFVVEETAGEGRQLSAVSGDGTALTLIQPPISGDEWNHIRLVARHFAAGSEGWLSPLLLHRAAALKPESDKVIAEFYSRRRPLGEVFTISIQFQDSMLTLGPLAKMGTSSYFEPAWNPMGISESTDLGFYPLDYPKALFSARMLDFVYRKALEGPDSATPVGLANASNLWAPEEQLKVEWVHGDYSQTVLTRFFDLAVRDKGEAFALDYWLALNEKWGAMPRRHYLNMASDPQSSSAWKSTAKAGISVAIPLVAAKNRLDAARIDVFRSALTIKRGQEFDQKFFAFARGREETRVEINEVFGELGLDKETFVERSPSQAEATLILIPSLEGAFVALRTKDGSTAATARVRFSWEEVMSKIADLKALLASPTSSLQEINSLSGDIGKTLLPPSVLSSIEPFSALALQVSGPFAQVPWLVISTTALTRPLSERALAVRGFESFGPPSVRSGMGEPLITGGAPRLPAGGDALDSAGFGESPPELPNSGPEATSVAQLVKGKALIGSEATEEEVMRRLSSAPLIHIAAHGLVLTDPALNPLSGLALGKTGLEFGKDGFLQAAEILANGPTSAKLVYLSGCATADSEIGTGALVKAFLHTGSRCVIAARWVLDDKESVAMARDFYTKFTAGATAGEALLAAQKAARARNRHPYYWANLALFGDPTVKFKGD